MGFFNFLKTRDISNVNWMNFPDTELRSEIIGASLHPLVQWMDDFIRDRDVFKDDSYIKLDSKALFMYYKSWCSQNSNSSFTGNIKSFGIIFKDNVELDKCKTEKKRSSSSIYFMISRVGVFD